MLLIADFLGKLFFEHYLKRTQKWVLRRIIQFLFFMKKLFTIFVKQYIIL